jgi:hypothetical protein
VKSWTSGRAWAYGAVALGATVSITANIAHSYVPPTGVPEGEWHPRLGAVLLAAFWPAALLVAVEVLARTEWPTGRRWVLMRWGGLLPVAAVAAVVSYQHLSGLLDYYGESSTAVLIGPASIDGLMTVASAALLAMATRQSVASEPAEAPTAPQDGQRSAPEAPQAPKPPAQRPKPSNGKAQATDEDLEQVVRPLVQAGKGRPTIQKALKDAGLTCETTKLANLIASLKDEPLTVS